MTTSLRKSPLDHDGYVPLYVQLANILRSRIESGAWASGEIIPTEPQLMQQYQVSRTTVREAVSLLVNEGLLVRKQGKGTMVRRPRVSEMLGQLTGFSEEIRLRGMVPNAKCLESTFVRAGPRVSYRLCCPEGTPVLRIYRLRYADEYPLALEESYWPKPIGQLLTQHDLHTSAYYDVLEHHHNIYLSSAEESISAVIASRSESELLQIATGDPLLQMERVTLSANYGLVEYCRTRYRADRYDYRIRLERHGAHRDRK